MPSQVKLNQAKADGGIKKGDINDTGIKDGEEQQNQATRNNDRCREPVITNEEENPTKKVHKTLAEKLAKDLTKVNTRPSPGSSPRTSAGWSPGTSPGAALAQSLARVFPCLVP